MPDGSDAIDFSLLSSMDDVAPKDWDALARAVDPTNNPFVTHAFLKAMEASGCTGTEAGWIPRHLVIRDQTGAMIAAAPMFQKSHSYGEYVFDWAWADAYQRAGGDYYPKLLVAAPFSPVTGPRLLCAPDSAPGSDGKNIKTTMGALKEVAKKLQVSSLHIIFPTKHEWEIAGEQGYLLREGRQFHWQNKGSDDQPFHDFDDFLSALSSRKRKNIRKERAQATKDGVVIKRLTGSDILPEHWDAFHSFYMDTAARKWGHPYLSHEFFHELGARLADRVLLVMAFREDLAIAGALNLFSDDALFGRNWGCLEDHPFLHFECCYYQAMDFAIERGLSRVEAGAGGHHKITRGYMPEATYSAHWIANSGFSNAVEQFLTQERREVDSERQALATRAPFKKDDNNNRDGAAPRSIEDEEGF